MYYLVISDRLSGWMETSRLRTGSQASGSSGIILFLKIFFATFGFPQHLSSGGGSEFMTHEIQNFFIIRYGVRHRSSSSYNPLLNGMTELAAKSTKRLLEDNLDTETFIRVLLIKRNTPDPICKLSPAEVVFGRKLGTYCHELIKPGISSLTWTLTLYGRTWKEKNPIWKNMERERVSTTSVISGQEVK